MNKNTFSFFPEVDLRFCDSRVQIESPWMSTTITLPEDVKSRFDDWKSLLAYSFAGFPFVKISPSKGEKKHLPGFDSQLAMVWSRLFQMLEVTKDVRPLWNHREIIDNSSLIEGYCTLSAFSCIQKEMFSRFPSSIGAVGLSTIIATLQQSHYVTSHCHHALSGGVDHHGEGLADYIKSEVGHHRIIERALRRLNVEPDLNEVHSATVSAINILSICARHFPFALCCCLSFFEQAAFYESDPIVEALLCLGEYEAAAEINVHFNINKREQHNLVGFYLAKEVTVDLNDLLMASLVCDVLVQLSHQLDTYLKKLDAS